MLTEPPGEGSSTRQGLECDFPLHTKSRKGETATYRSVWVSTRVSAIPGILL